MLLPTILGVLGWVTTCTTLILLNNTIYIIFHFIIVGGVSRGIVEGPFEYIKVRRQVEQPWRFTEIFNGSGATIFRNSFLFSGFVIYMDLLKQIVPGGLSPFWTGNLVFQIFRIYFR